MKHITQPYVDLYTEKDEELDIYLHLEELDLITLEFDYDKGLDGFLQRIVAEKDNKKIFEFFKQIILLAFGERDGALHDKSPEVKRRFQSHPAYNALAMRMLENEEWAADVIVGMFPKSIVKAHEKQQGGGDQDKPIGAPGSTMPAPPT